MSGNWAESLAPSRSIYDCTAASPTGVVVPRTCLANCAPRAASLGSWASRIVAVSRIPNIRTGNFDANHSSLVAVVPLLCDAHRIAGFIRSRRYTEAGQHPLHQHHVDREHGQRQDPLVHNLSAKAIIPQAVEFGW